MEDKRIKKSKLALKQSLIALLDTRPFDDLTVTEICKKADISRITFYAHYEDKYQLVEDIFEDLIRLATADFGNLQRENNPEGDAKKSYCNLLECILNLYENNSRFLSKATREKNPYLYYSFNNHVFRRIAKMIRYESNELIPKFDSKRLSAMLCTGLWAYLSECLKENCPLSEIKKEMKSILMGILESENFFKKP
ncbi:MAG: TetR/AcrR family transcriptional regulator [Eubacteriales bacterium]